MQASGLAITGNASAHLHDFYVQQQSYLPALILAHAVPVNLPRP